MLSMYIYRYFINISQFEFVFWRLFVCFACRQMSPQCAMTEAEFGVIQLQTKKCQEWMATTESSKKSRSESLMVSIELLTPRIWTSSLWNCERINVWCLGWTVGYSSPKDVRICPLYSQTKPDTYIIHVSVFWKVMYHDTLIYRKIFMV